MVLTIEIRGILLTRKGDHIVVEAWVPDGTYREVIRERAEGPISHCVHAGGIARAPITDSTPDPAAGHTLPDAPSPPG